MIEELRERLKVLESKLNEVNAKFEKHRETSPISNEKDYFTKYDELASKQYKLEKQIEKAKELLKTLEFIFED